VIEATIALGSGMLCFVFFPVPGRTKEDTIQELGSKDNEDAREID
jgi:hypothetical protein